MRFRSSFLVIMTLLSLFFSAGCERNESLPFAGEDSDPNFSRGKQLIRQGRNQEALSSFLKVIAKRGDDAPESHLEAGLIYHAHIRDQIAAIYHFRKYIELQPNSRQADLVAKRIEACTREFASSLPAHPLEDQSVKLGFMDQLDSLKRENEQLKAEITASRGGQPLSPNSYTRSGFDIPIKTAPNAAPSAAANEPEPPAPQPEEEVTDSPISRVPSAQDQPTIQSSTIAISAPTRPTSPAASTTPAATSPSSGRRHVITQGDTLYSLAQKYYGNRSRWKDIYQANKEQLRSQNDKLRIGMELKIP